MEFFSIFYHTTHSVSPHALAVPTVNFFSLEKKKKKQGKEEDAAEKMRGCPKSTTALQASASAFYKYYKISSSPTHWVI